MLCHDLFVWGFNLTSTNRMFALVKCNRIYKAITMHYILRVGFGSDFGKVIVVQILVCHHQWFHNLVLLGCNRFVAFGTFTVSVNVHAMRANQMTLKAVVPTCVQSWFGCTATNCANNVVFQRLENFANFQVTWHPLLSAREKVKQIQSVTIILHFFDI